MPTDELSALDAQVPEYGQQQHPTVIQSPEQQPVNTSPEPQQAAQQEQPPAQEPPEQGFMDTVHGLVDGVAHGAQATYNLAADALNAPVHAYEAATGQHVDVHFGGYHIPTLPEPQHVIGKLSEGTTQFLTGLAVGNKATAGMKLAEGVKNIAAGAVADFTAFDEHTHRLSDTINQELPSLSNPVTQFLASKPGDNWAESRLKNVLEGATLGAVPGAFVKTLKGIRSVWAARAAGNDSEALKHIEGLAKDTAGTPEAPPETSKPVAKAAPEDPPVDHVAASLGMTEADKTTLAGNLKKLASGQITPEEAYSGIPLNLDHLKSPEQTKGAIGSMAEALLKAGGKNHFNSGSVTHEQVMKQAQALDIDPDKLTSLLGSTNEALDRASAVMVAGKSLMQAHADYLQTLALNPDKTLADLAPHIATAARLVHEVKGIATGAGRLLNAHKIDVETGDTSKFMDQAVKNLELTGDAEAAAEHMKRRVAQAARQPTTLHRFSKAILGKWNKTVDGANELFVSSILSGPSTHKVNILTNALFAGMRPLETAAGRAVMGDLKGAKRSLGMFAHMRSALSDSLHAAKLAWDQDRNVMDMDHRTFDGPLHSLGDSGMAHVVRAPLRALQAEDEFFKQINYRAKVMEMATQDAIDRGLSTEKNIPTAAGKVSEFNMHLKRALDNSVNEYGEATNPVAMRYARETTFTLDLPDKTLGHSVQSLVSKHPAVRQIVPFIRTPVNILKQGFMRFPGLGLMQRDMKDAWESGVPEERAQVIGKQASGLLALSSAMFLAQSGHLTGGGPMGNKNLKSTLYNTGWKPYSIHVDGTYYPIDRLAPYAPLLMMYANYHELAASGTHEEHMPSLTAAVLMSTIKMMTDQTFTTGIYDLLDTIESGQGGKWQHYLDSRAAQMVPFSALQRQTSGALDPSIKDVQDFMDALRAQTPLLSSTVDPKYTFLGTPEVRSAYPWAAALVTPGYGGTDRAAPVMKELARLGMGIGSAPSKHGNVDLRQFIGKDDKTAYHRLNEIIAQSGLKDQLTRLINSDGYKRMPDTAYDGAVSYASGKYLMIKRLVSQERKLALLKLETEGYASPDTGTKLADALMGDRMNRRVAAYDPSSSLMPIK